MAQSHSAVMVTMWQVAWHPQLKELVKSTGLEMKLTWGCSSALLLTCGVFGKTVPITEPPFPHQSMGISNTSLVRIRCECV